MKTTDSNRVNMINSNIAYCDANATATAGITSFGLVRQVGQIGQMEETGKMMNYNRLKISADTINAL